MSTAALRYKVDRLRVDLGDRIRSGDECDRKLIGAIADVGDPEPTDGVPCPRCGNVHVLWIEEVVVDSPDAGEGAPP